MRVFISGRIRGMSDLSHFDRAEEYLISKGHITVNPVKLLGLFKNVPDDHGANEPSWARRFWMRESLRLLLDSEAVYFCPGMDSSGMKTDRMLQESLMLPVIE